MQHENFNNLVVRRGAKKSLLDRRVRVEDKSVFLFLLLQVSAISTNTIVQIAHSFVRVRLSVRDPGGTDRSDGRGGGGVEGTRRGARYSDRRATGCSGGSIRPEIVGVPPDPAPYTVIESGLHQPRNCRIPTSDDSGSSWKQATRVLLRFI